MHPILSCYTSLKCICKRGTRIAGILLWVLPVRLSEPGVNGECSLAQWSVGRGKVRKMAFPSGRAASRSAAQTTPRPVASRVRLDKRAWVDVRRACKLRAQNDVRAVEVHGVRVEFFWAGKAALEPKGKKGKMQQATRREAESASAQTRHERQRTAPNSAQKRSARRMAAFIAMKCEQQATAVSTLNPSAPPFEVGKRRRLDAQGTASAPESPRSEETRLIIDLSDTLEARAQQRAASACAQAPASVESTQEGGKGGTKSRGGGGRRRGGRGA